MWNSLKIYFLEHYFSVIGFFYLGFVKFSVESFWNSVDLDPAYQLSSYPKPCLSVICYDREQNNSFLQIAKFILMHNHESCVN